MRVEDVCEVEACERGSGGVRVVEEGFEGGGGGVEGVRVEVRGWRCVRVEGVRVEGGGERVEVCEGGGGWLEENVCEGGGV